jgi:hypothetical protein
MASRHGMVSIPLGMLSMRAYASSSCVRSRFRLPICFRQATAVPLLALRSTPGRSMQRRHWAQPHPEQPGAAPLLIKFDWLTALFAVYGGCRYEGYADFRLAIEKYSPACRERPHLRRDRARPPSAVPATPLAAGTALRPTARSAAGGFCACSSRTSSRSDPIGLTKPLHARAAVRAKG